MYGACTDANGLPLMQQSMMTHCACDDSGAATARAVLVDTPLGAVEGLCSTPENFFSPEMEGYQVFKAIPYAEAPVGPLRFAPAQPKRPWKPHSLARYDQVIAGAPACQLCCHYE